MKVLIGVDPHKASVAVAVVDEAKGDLIESNEALASTLVASKYSSSPHTSPTSKRARELEGLGFLGITLQQPLGLNFQSAWKLLS